MMKYYVMQTVDCVKSDPYPEQQMAEESAAKMRQMYPTAAFFVRGVTDGGEYVAVSGRSGAPILGPQEQRIRDLEAEVELLRDLALFLRRRYRYQTADAHEDLADTGEEADAIWVAGRMSAREVYERICAAIDAAKEG